MYAYNVEIFEAVTTSGAKCLLVLGNGHCMWIQDRGEPTPPAKLLLEMGKNGMAITDKDPKKAIVERIESCQPYAGEPPIDRPGHADNVFAWPDGTVSAPEGKAEPVTIYQRAPNLFRQSGTLSRFIKRCAIPMTGEPLFIFGMLLPLFAVFRPLKKPHDDVLIEIVAPFTDLSALHHMIASVTGGHEEAIAYQALAFHEALALPSDVDPHADHLLLLQNAQHFFASKAAGVRANEARQLLSAQLRAVTQRYSAPRTVLLIERVPLASLVGQDSDIGRLLSRKMVTLMIPPERPHGLFSRLPKNLHYASQYTTELRKVTAANRGVVYRRFVENLVHERANDPQKLFRLFQERVDNFVRHVAHDPNDAAAVAVVELFGEIYAVGCFAKDWKLLPACWKLGPSLREAYNTFYVSPGPEIAFADELRVLMRRPDALNIGYGQSEPSKKALAAAKLIIDHKRHSIDVVIRPGYLNAYIKNGTKRLHDVDVELYKQRDGRHQGIKKRNVTGDETRVHVFRMQRDEALNEFRDGAEIDNQ